MTFVRVGAASLNQTPMDWEGNRQRIIEAVEEAQMKRVQILCLPELCLTGYGCEDMHLSSHLHEKSVEVLKSLQGLGSFGMITTVGLPVRYGNSIYNTVCVIQDGLIRGFVPKQNLAQDGVHYEPRWFRPWPSGKVVQYSTSIGRFPFGDLTFETGNGIRFGFEICEDAWVSNRPGSNLSKRHVDIILNPSASHFAFGKQDVRRRFVLEGSRAFASAYVYANLLGNEAGRLIYDGSTMIAANGHMLQEGRRFSYRDHTLCWADVDVSVLRNSRFERSGFESIPGEEDPKSIVSVGYVDTTDAPEEQDIESDDWERGPDVKEHEFSRAVALGLADYLRRTRVNGYVVSLSGGADSSAVACLVALMFIYVEQELTNEEIRERFGWLGGFGPAMLTCIYQATINSSEETEDAARNLAQALGAWYIRMDIDSIVEDYTRLASHGLQKVLHWDNHDIALQNIQARARAPSAWMVANVQNRILLATSNQSEAAVGYATMDGDTAGGISPISGIDKAFLRHWLSWLEQQGHENGSVYRAFRSLDLVNAQTPTAELRPQDYDQTDESDLMPYPVLDEIKRQAIRDRKPPMAVLKRLIASLEEYSEEQLAQWVIRFFRLWCRNQWKRERYAPGFHLDDVNLDPKTWCRFPILSSGFDEELAEIAREYLK